MPADDWRIANARSLLGNAILLIADKDAALAPGDRSSRLQEAEGLMLAGYEGIKNAPGVPAPSKDGDRRREARERVATLYVVWDRVEPGKGYGLKAAEWNKRLDAGAPNAAPVEPEKRR